MTVQVFERTHDTPYPPREERIASRARWDAFARRLREHLRLSLGADAEPARRAPTRPPRRSLSRRRLPNRTLRAGDAARFLPDGEPVCA
jgi:hypothetical protein